MKLISHHDFEAFVAGAGIRCADPKLGIGSELGFAVDPLRVVVVYFAKSESEQHIAAVFGKLLALDETWFVAPRYGTVADMGIVEDSGYAAAVIAEGHDKEGLQEFLCGYFEPLRRITANDIYLISGSGKIIVTYDHHTHDEGLSVFLNDRDKAGQFLVGLNEIGTELELFSKTE